MLNIAGKYPPEELVSSSSAVTKQLPIHFLRVLNCHLLALPSFFYPSLLTLNMQRSTSNTPLSSRRSSVHERFTSAHELDRQGFTEDFETGSYHSEFGASNGGQNDLAFSSFNPTGTSNRSKAKLLDTLFNAWYACKRYDERDNGTCIVINPIFRLTSTCRCNQRSEL